MNKGDEEIFRRNYLRGAGSWVAGASVHALTSSGGVGNPVKMTLLDPTGAQEIAHLFMTPEEIKDRTDIRRAAAAAGVDRSKLPAV